MSMSMQSHPLSYSIWTLCWHISESCSHSCVHLRDLCTFFCFRNSSYFKNQRDQDLNELNYPISAIVSNVGLIMKSRGFFSQEIKSKEILTLLDLSGLFNADRIGLAKESHDDGTHSFSFSEILLPSRTSSTESASAVSMSGRTYNQTFRFWICIAQQMKRHVTIFSDSN